MRIIGIDPGRRGGVALATTQGVVDSEMMPGSLQELVALIEQWEVTHAYVEKAQARPGQGVTSMFNYGCGFGKTLGVLVAKKIPFRQVSPTEWTRALHKGFEGATAKDRSKNAALSMFPNLGMFGPRGAFLDGIADAALICEFGRREIIGRL